MVSWFTSPPKPKTPHVPKPADQVASAYQEAEKERRRGAMSQNVFTGMTGTTGAPTTAKKTLG